jgi:putative Holliday junction resolvase
MSNPVGDPPISIPTTGRLGGIDFGTVRIGIATCDPSQSWVTPYDTYVRRSEVLDAQFFNQLAKSDDIVGWILGLPIHCDGQESMKSAEVRDFARWLSETTQIGVSFFDERFTTAEARRLLQASGMSPKKKKKRLDGLAAHLILSHFLESRRRQTSQNESLDDAP